MNEPSILYYARLHRIIFLWPIVFLIASLYLLINYPSIREPSLILCGVAVLWFIMTWVTYYFSSLTLKQNLIILRTGLIIRKTFDIPLNKIESIDITQSILGSIFRYGALVITGTGGTRHLINYLCKPLTCRRHIEQAMHQVPKQ
jgi:uncharacterized membrane protein YdbT with pleckstrin-like domain